MRQWLGFRGRAGRSGFAANVIVGLIRVATYLLARQLRHLENAFVEEGGLRERMTRARLQERNTKGSGKG